MGDFKVPMMGVIFLRCLPTFLRLCKSRPGTLRNLLMLMRNWRNLFYDYFLNIGTLKMPRWYLNLRDVVYLYCLLRHYAVELRQFTRGDYGGLLGGLGRCWG